jgi:hypothetical protein
LKRKAGITALGVVSEGCLFAMKENLKDLGIINLFTLVPIIKKGLEDENDEVRYKNFII